MKRASTEYPCYQMNAVTGTKHDIPYNDRVSIVFNRGFIFTTVFICFYYRLFHDRWTIRHRVQRRALFACDPSTECVQRPFRHPNWRVRSYHHLQCKYFAERHYSARSDRIHVGSLFNSADIGIWPIPGSGPPGSPIDEWILIWVFFKKMFSFFSYREWTVRLNRSWTDRLETL